MRYFVLRLATLLSDVPGWIVVLLFRLLWGRLIAQRDGCLVTYLEADSWPSRTWYRRWGGTTFGHAILINRRARDIEAVLSHESRHVEQYEVFSLAGMLAAVVLACLGHPWIALSAAVSSGFVIMLLAMTVAWLRGESFYRGSFLEEAAYDAEELRRRQGEEGGGS